MTTANYQELFKRINRGLIYPPLLEKLHELTFNCLVRGVTYFATSGTRGEKEQTALYAQGRTTPGLIVTNAKFGQSAHSFGVGVDFTHDKDSNSSNGLQPDWDPLHYQVLAEEAIKLGLEAGFYWKFKDNPHVQLNLTKHGIKLADLKAIEAKDGIVGVWKYLDTFAW